MVHWKIRSTQILGLISVLAFALAGNAAAQDAKQATDYGDHLDPEEHHDLTTAATNPVGALIQVQLQDLYTPNSRSSDGYANTGIFQLVAPLPLPKGGYFEGLITRTTLPIVTTPEINGDRETGLGDLTSIIAATHTESQGGKEFFTWGPVLGAIVPTANKRETGSGVLSLGPGLIALKNIAFENGDSMMVGGLAYQTWSVTNGTNNVSKTWAQPVLVYKFKELFGQGGWYLRNPDDLWSYDWNTSDWAQIPVGGALGRVFPIGKQPVNVFAGGWYNPVSDNDGVAADYAFKVSLSLLFPK